MRNAKYCSAYSIFLASRKQIFKIFLAVKGYCSNCSRLQQTLQQGQNHVALSVDAIAATTARNIDILLLLLLLRAFFPSPYMSIPFPLQLLQWGKNAKKASNVTGFSLLQWLLQVAAVCCNFNRKGLIASVFLLLFDVAMRRKFYFLLLLRHQVFGDVCARYSSENWNIAV